MDKFEKIKVTNSDGKEVEINIITVLQKSDDDKKFALYTFDTESDDIDIYASEIKENDGAYTLDIITEKEDWDLVQKAIAELSE